MLTNSVVIGFVTYAFGAVILALWLAGVTTFSGFLLRETHYEVARTRSFTLVRRYGLVGGGRRLLWKMRVDRNTIRRIRNLNWAFVVPPLVGFFAPTSFLFIIHLLVVSGASNVTQDVLLRVVLIIGLLGAMIATWIWVRGLSYIANPRVEHGRAPELRTPKELSKNARDRLAINIYWCEHGRHHAEPFCMIYPLIIFFLVSVIASPSSFSELSSTSNSVNVGPPQVLLGLLYLVIAVTPSAVPTLIVFNRVRRRFSGSRAAVEICRLLWPSDGGKSDSEVIGLDLIPESSEANRGTLIRITELLNEAGRQLDVQQPRGFTPHPRSTILRGVAHVTRQHLATLGAHNPQLPEDLKETLRRTLFILVGSSNANDYKELAARVSAFDEAGQPSVELFTKPPGRVARFYERATSTAARTGGLIAALTSVAVPITALALAALGGLEIEPLLNLLK